VEGAKPVADGGPVADGVHLEAGGPIDAGGAVDVARDPMRPRTKLQMPMLRGSQQR
jgi:hypothetical protein